MHDLKKWIIIFLITVGLSRGTAWAPPEIDQARAKAQELLANMAVIGASQSNGFMSGVLLRDVLDRAITFEHSSESFSNAFFFQNPERHGKRQIKQVLKTEATSMIALDYLFWYVYGNQPLESRLSGLQVGLDNLDQFSGIIYVGDIPNMEGASPIMLPKSLVPPIEHLNLANEMIKKWVEERERVELLPLASWVNAMRTDGEIELDGKVIKMKKKDVMSWDGLHTNIKGQGFIAALCLDEIHSSLPALSQDDLIKDTDTLHKIALARFQEILDAAAAAAATKAEAL